MKAAYINPLIQIPCQTETGPLHTDVALSEGP